MINFLDTEVLTGVELARKCGGADVLKIIKFAFTLIDIVLFVIPVALIIMLMIDFGKNVMAGKEDEMKKSLNLAIKRIISCVVLFFIPYIVKFAINIASNAVDPDDNTWALAASCMNLAMEASDYALNHESWQIDYENLDDLFDDTDGSGGNSSVPEPNPELRPDKPEILPQ